MQKKRPKSKYIPPVFKPKKPPPLEKKVEQRLCKKIKELNGACYKFSSPQRKGVSDRIVMVFGFVFFVELKREGVLSLSRTQKIFKQVCTEQNVYFCTVSGYEGVDQFIEFIKSREDTLDCINRFSKPLFPLFNDIVFK